MESFACDKCGMHAVQNTEVKKLIMSTTRRRHYVCTSCSHEDTRYEVPEAFYRQAIENERLLHQLRLYIDRKPGVVNKHTKDCTTCEYNMETGCNFDVPEFGTPEASGCSYYAIKKWRTSPGASQLV